MRESIPFVLIALASCARPHDFSGCTNARKIDLDLQELGSLLRAHVDEHGAPPTSWSELELALERHVPLDPWKNAYVLEASTDSRVARIGTLGRDAVPGGADDDADVFVDLRW